MTITEERDGNQLFFLQHLENEITSIFSNLSFKSFDGMVNVAEIKSGELEKIKKSQLYKDCDLILGESCVWHKLPKEVGKPPIEDIKFCQSKYFPTGVVLIPTGNYGAEVEGSRTAYERKGFKVIEYNGTIFGAFESLYFRLEQMGKKFRDSEKEVLVNTVIYRSQKARRQLGGYERKSCQ